MKKKDLKKRYDLICPKQFVEKGFLYKVLFYDSKGEALDFFYVAADSFDEAYGLAEKIISEENESICGINEIIEVGQSVSKPVFIKL